MPWREKYARRRHAPRSQANQTVSSVSKTYLATQVMDLLHDPLINLDSSSPHVGSTHLELSFRWKPRGYRGISPES